MPSSSRSSRATIYDTLRLSAVCRLPNANCGSGAAAQTCCCRSPSSPWRWAAAAFRADFGGDRFVGGGGAIALLGLLTPEAEIYAAVEWPILDHDRRADPDWRGGARTPVPTELLADLISRICGAHLPAYGILALILARDDAGDTDPASRRRRSGHGADRGRISSKLWLQDRSILDCRGARRGIRFPVADRPSIEHPCHGTRSDTTSRITGNSELPLSLIVVGVGVPLILLLWPLG